MKAGCDRLIRLMHVFANRRVRLPILTQTEESSKLVAFHHVFEQLDQ